MAVSAQRRDGESSGAPGPWPTAAAPGARVLVMDDDQAVLQTASFLLSKAGFEVTGVEDGARAVAEHESARASGRPYDVLILDLTVPAGMGGEEAMRRIRATDKSVKAIISSGYTSEAAVSRYADFGFDSVVTKPYCFQDLVSAVNRLLPG